MDLSVKFEEPVMDAIDLAIQKRFADEYTPAGMDVSTMLGEPTVGGLTGQQLSLLREIQAENHCWYEVYPVSPKGPAEYCIEPREDWSSYCEQHAYQVAREQPVGPTYDEYDSYRDREFE